MCNLLAGVMAVMARLCASFTSDLRLVRADDTRRPRLTETVGSSAQVLVLHRSNVVVLPVPIHKALDSDIDRGGRLESGVLDQGIDIGVGGRHVTRLHVEHVLFSFHSQAGFERLYHGHELDRLMVADVVESVGSVAATRIGGVS